MLATDPGTSAEVIEHTQRWLRKSRPTDKGLTAVNPEGSPASVRSPCNETLALALALELMRSASGEGAGNRRDTE